MPSIFLSHNWADKPFVRKLADRLSQEGVSVWLDDAQLNIGDSLIQKISEAIEQMDYVAAVISSNSIKSNWVQTELSLAMTKEIEGKRVVVLPLLIESCSLPEYLKGKLYGDFTKSGNFEEQFSKLLKAIGVTQTKANFEEAETKVKSLQSGGYTIETSNARIELARICRIQKRYDEAVKILREALEINPEKIEVYSELALTYRDQSRFAEAIELIQKGLSIAPDDFKSLMEMAIIYQEQNRYDEAEKQLLKVINMNPDYLRARSELAKVYKVQGRYDAAEKMLREILTIGSSSI